MRLVNADAIHYTRLLSQQGLDMELVPKTVIDNMPTIDAEPVRHCAWSLKETYHGSMDDDVWWVEWSAICPECGMVVYLDPVSCECGMLKDALAEYNYCSKCGAKMDLEVQDD